MALLRERRYAEEHKVLVGGWGVVTMTQSRCGGPWMSVSWFPGLLEFSLQFAAREMRAQMVEEIFDSARCDPGPFIIRRGSARMGRISEDSESAVGILFP